MIKKQQQEQRVKECIKCTETKELSTNYHKNIHSPDGYKNICKGCIATEAKTKRLDIDRKLPREKVKKIDYVLDLYTKSRCIRYGFNKDTGNYETKLKMFGKWVNILNRTDASDKDLEFMMKRARLLLLHITNDWFKEAKGNIETSRKLRATYMALLHEDESLIRLPQVTVESIIKYFNKEKTYHKYLLKIGTLD